MLECKTFISVKEICKVLSVSESKSYAIVRDLNKELSDQGYMVIPGRVSRKYFEERFYGVDSLEKEDEEGSQLVTNCHQLKMTAQDGKKRMTDVANTEQLLRIIQSIPSKKAEPFKMWLAQVGRERIEEVIDPELN